MLFTPDSSQLILGGFEFAGQAGKVQVYDVNTGTKLHDVPGLKDVIYSCAISQDGRMLATGIGNGAVHIWEFTNLKLRREILGHQLHVFSMDFSPNGHLLATASEDAPIYLWNPYAPEKPTSFPAKLTKEHREKLWQQLADNDAALAFKATCELIAHPSEAVPILEGGWNALPRATAKELQNWLEELGSEDFGVRQAAGKELERVAAQHEGWLRESLQKAASLETRRRLEKILEQIEPQRWRLSRMLEVLEQIGTVQARQFMHLLAGQEEDERLAHEAKAGLERSAKPRN